MSFRKNVPYNILETALAGTWTAILTKAGVQRIGDLQTGAGQRVDLAFSATPAAGTIVTIGAEPREYLLPAHKPLYARAEGGGLGPAELHGTLWAE